LGKEFFDPFAGGVGELSLGDCGDDLMTFAAPGINWRAVNRLTAKVSWSASSGMLASIKRRSLSVSCS
jgi:hypothetical protein